MSEREYAVCLSPVHGWAGPRIYPAGNEYQARRQAASYAGDGSVEARVVWRYRFIPDMPWEDAC